MYAIKDTTTAKETVNDHSRAALSITGKRLADGEGEGLTNTTRQCAAGMQSNKRG